MKMIKAAIIGLSSLILIEQVIGKAALAQSFTIARLDQHCRSYLTLIKKTRKRPLTKSQAVDIVKCNSFIAGFHFGKTATNVENDTLGPYCLPHGDKTTSNWLIRNFVRWAARHPRHKKKTAAYGIMRSLQEHHACDERDRKN